MYEKFYTQDFKFAIKELIELKKKNKFSSFIDTSCGDNFLIHELLSNNLILKYLSYDISSNEHFGKIIEKDWLLENTSCTRKSMVGFNPPYGFGSKKAKKFIHKGYVENHEFCMWLVPISLKSYLLSLYEPLYQKEIISLTFINNNESKHKAKIKQSVILFIGKRLFTPIILSETKPKKSMKYKLKRTHNEGILKDTTFLLKKTGNPVFFPSFYKPDISQNIWWQINKTGIVKKDAKLVIDGKFKMTGNHITKHLCTSYNYAVDSNIYVKISGLEKHVDMEIFIKKIISLGNTDDFFNLVNKYKPAAITIGWLREFIDNFIN
tara:strand:- start:259 stop:1224 length:966 start_codon:yes stop_codon:yes gene_type:complete